MEVNGIKNRKGKKNRQNVEGISEKIKTNTYEEDNKLTSDHLRHDNVDTTDKIPRQECASIEETNVRSNERFKLRLEIDLISVGLFLVAFALRMYKLDKPRSIIFDELHYGRYICMYLKRTFFFDAHPPLGKQLIAALVYLTGFDGDFKFDKIGSPYPATFPLFAFRFIPAFTGSLLIPTVYNILMEMKFPRFCAVFGAVLILLDNALLTQSRFILLDSILLFFTFSGVYLLLKLEKTAPLSPTWFIYLTTSFLSFSCAICTKFAGVYSYFLALLFIAKIFCSYLTNKTYSNPFLTLVFLIKTLIILTVTITLYISVYYIHLTVLTKAGPHDTIMTSAFQASLEGGLASITKNQPLYISHGSQITLRHTHGRTCWLHSHAHVYPVKYADGRGSSHQQQVTCYSFKDVNNWWIVKRPGKNSLVVDERLDVIKHGDLVQLVHGITSRALNSHDVAAPVSPQCQEVSCYIDYNVSMPAQNLWQVEIINKDEIGDAWQTIQSHVRLVHVNSSQSLKFSGRQLPDWGFHQHEVVTDKIKQQEDTVWNVEEHRYTKSENQKEREKQLLEEEMIPLAATQLSFWAKFSELQRKILFTSTSSSDQSHMFSSEPYEWPLITRGIAYWVAKESNAQIHLIGNIALWYSSTASIILYTLLLIFYCLRQRRNHYDIDSKAWEQFINVGFVFGSGYLLHYVPYFLLERTLFLYHYLPAFVFAVLLLTGLAHHFYYLFGRLNVTNFKRIFFVCSAAFLALQAWVFWKFLVFSYGEMDLTVEDIVALRWKDSWHFIVHKNAIV